MGRLRQTFRPRLELLEDRIQLGDTLLGLATMALGGLSAASLDAPLARDPRPGDGEWQDAIVSHLPTAGTPPAIVLLGNSGTAGAESRTIGDPAGTVQTTSMTTAVDMSIPLSDGWPAGQMAIPRFAGFSSPLPEALTANRAAIGGRGEAPFSPAAFATIGESAVRSLGLFAASATTSPASRPVNLSFDVSTGQLGIHADAGQHTIREALAAGFVDVTIDGQSHSSNPASASFDQALTGATGARLSGIRFEGGGSDRLILDSQQLAGGVTVQAAGATVITEDVASAGPLAIQAPNITVNGALQGNSVSLAASGWVTVDATGRIDAVPSQQRARDVSPPSAITVAAGVFVNSGQLHADGSPGGQIAIAAGNVLNAGPITADSIGASGNSGRVSIAFTGGYVATAAAVVSASSRAGAGGQVTIDGGSTGRLYSSGRQLATGWVGGAVDLFGREVILSGATVDASGQAGGGSVRIGGGRISDFGFRISDFPTDTVIVTPASSIHADALHSGGGGRVSIWAQQTTAFAGAVSARGGLANGSGGLIEVSGHSDLSFGGSADAGKGGTLFLDPKNITISDAPVGVFPQFDLIDPHPTAGGGFGTRMLVLSNGNIVVTNPNDDFGGTGAGAVYLFDGLSGALLSALFGSHPNDQVGLLPLITLNNGNYIIQSVFWNGNSGAVTWGSGRTGVSGIISDANSLVGSDSGDSVGSGVSFLSLPGIVLLSNDNYLIVSPFWNGGFAAGLGAVTWGNGSTGVRGTISEANSLVGSNPGDRVGHYGVILLSNGNYVVKSPDWNSSRGAATWGNGSTGISGPVSAANSLVGSNPGQGIGNQGPGDVVGLGGITPLSNGNYVVESPNWNGNRGAVTWGSGSTGVSGTISDANSLVGSNPGDGVGGGVPLSNGNYLVTSVYWNGGRGAVTWGNGSTGTSGIVSEANSLVGSNPSDREGLNGIILLSNGNYLVVNPGWNNDLGAVTWGDGSAGVKGIISAANSLIGSNPGDEVGNFYGITFLSNGNYVVRTVGWHNGRGAVTWGNGSTGTSGIVSEANSLVGDPGDWVGGKLTYISIRPPLIRIIGDVVPLRNGNYVVESLYWHDQRGAATWGNGSTGTSGPVSAANSLVGSTPTDNQTSFGDQVGSAVAPLSNGNYVVESAAWNGNRGALTLGNGSTGVSGVVSEANSLVGGNPGDVGWATQLPNGNYVVGSPLWNGNRGAVTWIDGNTELKGTFAIGNSLTGDPGDFVGSGGVIFLNNGNYLVLSQLWSGDRGAVTWVNGSTGLSGSISDANSLIGSDPGDSVGINGVVPLSNGNYLVLSLSWHDQSGAVTWGNGSTGISGVVSEANSLVGSNPGDGVGFRFPGSAPGLIFLNNGNYVVLSPYWNGNRGAVTWGSATTGVRGTVSDANSVVGSNPGNGPGQANSGDLVGYGGITPLSNGNYLVYSRTWNGGYYHGQGAVTWVSGTSGQTMDGLGTITPQNSLIGTANNNGLTNLVENSVDQTFLATFLTDEGGRVTAGFTDPSRLTYATGQSQTVSITPDFLTRTLDTGTAVVLQASNDITVNSPIAVNAGGNGGALTLQAGRSILLNAPITTDNGALTLIANDSLANGVVDAERDPGNAVITMAAGTTLDTGSGALTVQMRDGAGLTNHDSGAITLQSVTAGSVSVVNHGPDAGSDINLGTVTTTGPQSYANPNGTTTLTANLTAADSPITFNDSVVINAGLTLNVGAGTVTFAGTVAPSPGLVTIAGGVVLTGSTTFSATLTGIDAGSYSQLAAIGPINLGDSTLSLVLGFEPPVGSSFEILTNMGTGPISGTFHGLDEGALFSQGSYQFQITYQGGTGSNSVVLTRLA